MLCMLCYHHQDVPESAKITDWDVDLDTGHLEYSTRAVSVYRKVYQGHLVAVYRPSRRGTRWRMVSSVILLDPTGGFFQPATQKFCKEAAIWRHLRHPNILPFVGIIINPDQCLLVLDWGNVAISDFVGWYPDANRVDLVG